LLYFHGYCCYCWGFFVDSGQHFITTVNFSSHIKSLATGQQCAASEVVAFGLRLAGHLIGVLSPMPLSNREFADAVDMLFSKVVEADVLFSQARVRAAWLIGLQHAVADGHSSNRQWLSKQGKH